LRNTDPKGGKGWPQATFRFPFTSTAFITISLLICKGKSWKDDGQSQACLLTAMRSSAAMGEAATMTAIPSIMLAMIWENCILKFLLSLELVLAWAGNSRAKYLEELLES